MVKNTIVALEEFVAHNTLWPTLNCHFDIILNVISFSFFCFVIHIYDESQLH